MVPVEGAGFWGYNPVCKVTPVILHGVVSPEGFRMTCPRMLENPRRDGVPGIRSKVLY